MFATAASLERRGDHLVLAVEGEDREVSAMDVFKVAVRGAESIRGYAVRPVHETCAGVRFHGQPGARWAAGHRS